MAKDNYEYQDGHTLFRDDANTPEIKANVQKWVTALREPGRKQTTGVLCRTAKSGSVLGECCLGVGCDVLGVGYITDGGVKRFLGNTVYLPCSASESLGLLSYSGEIQPPQYTEDMGVSALSNLNDSGWTFPEIADLICQFWKGQFGEEIFS